MIPPIWSMWAWVGMTASTSAGSMPDCLRLATSRPMSSLRLTELMPVSNKASLSPVLIAHHLGKFLRGGTAEGVLRIADRQRSVRDHRRLDGSELEAIERGCWRVQRRRLGLR